MSILHGDTNRHRAAFPGDSSGVRTARAWLWGYIDRHPRANDIELVAAELAANAMKHTASGGWLFALRVEHEQAGSRVTVEDLGSVDSKPDLSNRTEEDVSGHGLALVAALADAWGVEGDCLGRDVWAWFDAP